MSNLYIPKITWNDLTAKTRLCDGIEQKDLNGDWNSKETSYKDGYLTIANSQVMHNWEYPVMKKMAEIVSSKSGSILEVGFGMGISSKLIRSQNISKYSVIEYNSEIANKARNDGVEFVYEGSWVDVLPTLSEKFDGVFYDAYPASDEEDAGVHYLRFILNVRDIMKPNGIFTYFTGRPNSMYPNHLALLLQLFNSVQLYRVPVSVPNDCKYFQGDNMIVVGCHEPSEITSELAVSNML